MKIAFVTPWPPQHTGIADYVFDLTYSLLKFGISIFVYSDCENPNKIPGVEIYDIKNRDISELTKYDLIIYQMGNNINYHLYMHDLIKEYRGIVHLHDMVLHHTMAWTTWGQGNCDLYLLLLKKWYGENISVFCHKMIKMGINPWDSGIVTDIPMFEETIQYAEACIAHSKFAKRKIENAFPELNVYRVDQVYKNIKISQKSYAINNGILKIGVFGGVDIRKHVDIIIKAFLNLLEYNPYCEMHIVGGVDESCKYIYEIPQKHHIKEKVFFHGRTDEKKFHKLMSDMDLVVSLRYPTTGETSAVVMKAMQMGIPVIVNDIGWFGELPDFVDKVPINNIYEKLLNILKKYITEKDYLTEKKQEFVRYSKKHLDVNKIVKSYLNILNKEYREKTNHKLIEIISDLIEDLNIDEAPILQNTIKKLDTVFC